MLTANPKRGGLRINVSHSLGVGLVAVTCEREIGADAEHLRLDLGMKAVAETVYPGRKSILRPASAARPGALPFCGPEPTRRLVSEPIAGAYRCHSSMLTSPV